jgi:hypothetical protein
LFNKIGAGSVTGIVNPLVGLQDAISVNRIEATSIWRKFLFIISILVKNINNYDTSKQIFS